jgi:carboxyl-terminal processing protease
LIEDNAKWIDNEARKNNYSLNIESSKEQKLLKKLLKKYKPIIVQNVLQFTSLPYEIEQMVKDNVLKEREIDGMRD